jgi:hypothetical protein
MKMQQWQQQQQQQQQRYRCVVKFFVFLPVK